MLARGFLSSIRFYKKFISPYFSQGSCRYYPTCSEYARWHFENSPFFRALFCSFFRVLRCNKFFSGGFDYPKFYLDTKNISNKKKGEIRYWFVPTKRNKFFIIKDLACLKN